MAQIGSGVSGTVDLYVKKDAYYVVKTYHSREPHESRKEYKERVLAEYHILKLLHHENFISVRKHEVLVDGLTIKMYMEAGSRDLAMLLKKAKVVDDLEMLCLWKQLCHGVQYLHGLGICHRDLKLENLVIGAQGNILKIIDLATAFKGHDAVGIVGSPRYLAPETASSIHYDGMCADIWSVGIILYYLLNRTFPWPSALWNDREFAAFAEATLEALSITEGAQEKHSIGIFQHLPEQAVTLARHVLEVDPLKRYDIEHVTKDAWFSNISSCGRGCFCGCEHKLK